jgi:transcription elongation factor Elf1
MSKKAWLDVSVFQCPRCGRYYVDASWYAVELESDIECGSCHEVFNTKRQITDRVMLDFKIDEKGKMLEAEVTNHII